MVTRLSTGKSAIAAAASQACLWRWVKFSGMASVAATTFESHHFSALFRSLYLPEWSNLSTTWAVLGVSMRCGYGLPLREIPSKNADCDMLPFNHYDYPINRELRSSPSQPHRYHIWLCYQYIFKPFSTRIWFIQSFKHINIFVSRLRFPKTMSSPCMFLQISWFEEISRDSTVNV